jgi:hypothetical protein
VQGRVVRLSAPQSAEQAAHVAVRFASLPFEKERLIARWLDLISRANRANIAA